MPARTDGCCGTHAMSTRPMRSSPTRPMPRPRPPTRPPTSRQPTPSQPTPSLRRRAEVLRLLARRPDLPGRRRLCDGEHPRFRRPAGRRLCRVVGPGGAGDQRHRQRGDRGRPPGGRRGRAGHRRSHRAAPGLRPAFGDARRQAGHARHHLRCRLAHQGDGDFRRHPAARRARADRSRPAGRRLLAGLRRQRQGRHHRPPAHDPLCRPAGRYSDAGLVGLPGRARHRRRAQAAGAPRHALQLQRRRFHRAGRDRAARVGPAAGDLQRPAHLPAARHARYHVPAAGFAERPHRPGRPPGLRTALGRRPRSAGLSHGRRRGPGRRVHHRRRPHEVRADDAVGRQGRAEAGLRRGDDDAAEPAWRGRPARPGLGHQFALRRVVRALLLDALLRPHRLYRHGDLDRPRDENLPDRAHQPAASRRQGQHPADAAAHRRGRGRRVARPAGARAVGHRRARSLWLSRAGGTPGRAYNQPLGAQFGGTADGRRAAPGARARACGAVQPRTRSRRIGRGQDRLQPRFRDRPADPQSLRQHDAADGQPC